MSGELTKKSGLVYLGVFLCVLCAVATALMGTVSVITKKPIEEAKSRKVAEGLKIVLPEFDNDPMETVQSFEGGKIYTAEKDGAIVGYAVEASSGIGYGGKVSGLIGYLPDGSIRTFIITTHNETPGLGTKVTDRIRQRTIFDIIQGTEVNSSLPPNPILDQFAGRKLLLSGDAASASGAAAPWSVKKDGGDLDFVSGATISSRAAADLAWRASTALAAQLAETATTPTTLPEEH